MKNQNVYEILWKTLMDIFHLEDLGCVINRHNDLSINDCYAVNLSDIASIKINTFDDGEFKAIDIIDFDGKVYEIENYAELYARRHKMFLDFDIKTKDIREKIAEILNQQLHKRVDVVSTNTINSESGTNLKFEVRIYKPNNFDYDCINLNYNEGFTVKRYADIAADAYTNQNSYKEYISDVEFTPNEKLFMTWLEATGMNECYSLSPEGVVCVEGDTKDYINDDGNSDEIYVQDFTLSFDGDTCVLKNDEYESYYLDRISIDKISF